MASETSGDFVGACEHPTRIPTTSSASEATYTGKVLILDLLNHASSCFDRMHTSIAALCSQTTQADWAHVQSWLGNLPPAADVANGANLAITLQRGPSPRATAARYCTSSGRKLPGRSMASLALPAPTGISPAPAAQ